MAWRGSATLELCDRLVPNTVVTAGGLAAEEEGDAPHIILFPEIAFNREKFLAKVKRTVKKHGFCVIVASEGAQYKDGTFLAESGLKDAFGHSQLGGLAPNLAQMVKDELGYKYHWAVADYLQRSARHIASHRLVASRHCVCSRGLTQDRTPARGRARACAHTHVRAHTCALSL